MAIATATEHAARNERAFPAVLELASQEVFRMMVGSELERSRERPWGRPVFTAMVGLAGNLCGVLSVRCGQDAAGKIASLMLGLPPEKAAEQGWDALGEIANMIAGNFKNKLNGVADGCMLSIPTVITGVHYTLQALHAANPIVLWFTFQGKPLAVTLEFKS